MDSNDILEQAKPRDLYEESRSVFGHPIARYFAERVKTKREAKELDHDLGSYGFSNEAAKAVRALVLLRLEDENTYKQFSDGLEISPLSLAGFTRQSNLWIQDSWKMGPDYMSVYDWPRLLKAIGWSSKDPQVVETTSLFTHNERILNTMGGYRDISTGSSSAAIIVTNEEKCLVPELYQNPERDNPVNGLVVRYLGILIIYNVDKYPRFMHVVQVERTRAEDDQPERQEKFLIAVPADRGPRDKMYAGFAVYQRSLTYVHDDRLRVTDHTISVEAGFNLMLREDGWRLFACNQNQLLGSPRDLPSVKMAYYHKSHWTGHGARSYPISTEETAVERLRPDYLRLLGTERTPEQDQCLLGEYLFSHPETDLLDLLAPSV